MLCFLITVYVAINSSYSFKGYSRKVVICCIGHLHLCFWLLFCSASCCSTLHRSTTVCTWPSHALSMIFYCSSFFTAIFSCLLCSLSYSLSHSLLYPHPYSTVPSVLYPTAPQYLTVLEKTLLCSYTPPERSSEPTQCIKMAEHSSKIFTQVPKKSIGTFSANILSSEEESRNSLVSFGNRDFRPPCELVSVILNFQTQIQIQILLCPIQAHHICDIMPWDMAYRLIST